METKRFDHRRKDSMRPEAFDLLKKGKLPVDVAIAMNVRVSIVQDWLKELRLETREACRKTSRNIARRSSK